MTDIRWTILFCVAALLFSSAAFAQKEDANWVFGGNCGLHFENDTVTNFITGLYTFENAASISNKDGDLQLCIGWKDKFNAGRPSIFDGHFSLIYNATSVNLSNTFAQGIIFLPIIEEKKYLLIHNSLRSNCIDNILCPGLYASYIENTDSGWTVTQANLQLINDLVDESLAITRHANGKDWWIVCHKGNDLSTDCNNSFYVFRTYNGVVLPASEYKIGQNSCDNILGILKISPSGNKIAYADVFDWEMEVFDFDRCSGIISNVDKIQLPGTSMPYGIEFSPSERFLYVTSDNGFGSPQGNKLGLLYQIDLTDKSRYTVWQDSFDNFVPGQLKLGPDNRVYMAYSSPGSIVINYNYKNQYLSVLAAPDSLGAACDFRPFHIYLGDSSYSSLSLPNMPNYNLGPLPVYMADAGRDTFYCVGDEGIKAFPIGGDSIYGITYQWEPAPGIDTLTNPTQLVLPPPQSRWYYVTLTDTNYVGPSCNSRVDSVYIEVRTCTGITETQTLQAKLYPNPTTGTFTIELPAGQAGNIALYNLLGQNVFNASINGTATMQMDLPQGVYIYRISSGGKVNNGKLLVE